MSNTHFSGPMYSENGFATAPVKSVITAAGTYNIQPFTSVFVTNYIANNVTLTLPNLPTGTIAAPNEDLNGLITSILNDSDTHTVSVVPFAANQLLNGNNIPVVIPAGWGADIYSAGISTDAWAMRIYPVFQLARLGGASLPAAHDGAPSASVVSGILIAAGLMLEA